MPPPRDGARPAAAPARAAARRAVLQVSAGDADNARLANLAGVLDANLRQIETELDVAIKRRGHDFRIEGERERAQRAVGVLTHFLERADQPISPDDIQLYLVELGRDGAGGAAKRARPADGAPPDDDLPVLRTKRRDLHGRTPRQRDYLHAILEHDISFGIGPAGTGKTYLAVACAVDALERDAVQRIVLTRPAVEAGERLGFLPGDLAQKVDPYLRPLYDALYDLLGFDKTQRLLERQTIEIAPLAYMRGRTLNQAFVILDEAQNTTPEQMKMFLTRIGFGSKAVVTGDVTQMDLPRGTPSGLVQTQHVLRGVRGIAFTYFTAADVVRHPLVARIVEAYERFDAAEGPEQPREPAGATAAPAHAAAARRGGTRS
ncbi:MAG TPA: PhoH family protein [Burkholderiaceae bacterium]|nr:PhoH family protein [Burkholderiaceae bacterium]